MSENTGYNVVFEGVGEERSNFPGVRTWTSFSSKEAFDKFLLEGCNDDTVVAAGVSPDEAIGLTRATDSLAELNGAFLEANQYGEFNRDLLQLKINNILFARGYRGQGGQREGPTLRRIAGLLEE